MADPLAAAGRRRAPRLSILVGGWLMAQVAPCLADDAVWRTPEAIPAQRLSWAGYPHVRPAEYAATFSVPVLLRLIVHNTRESDFPRWNSPTFVDTRVRDLLVARNERTLKLADTLSDVTWYTTSLWPLLDVTIVALALDKNPEVAWQLSAIGLEAYALTGFVTLTAIRASARERPRTAACLASGADPEECNNIPHRGFPSGHTSGSFTGAGLVCSSHLALPLYGSKAADAAACAGALTLATGTLVLRLVTDAHYATDGLAGAGIGLSFGWLMPHLLHYALKEGPKQPDLVVLPTIDQSSVAVSATGSF